MAKAEGEAAALEFTPTWIVAAICSLIVLISLVAERLIHYLGKVLLLNFERPVRVLDLSYSRLPFHLSLADLFAAIPWISIPGPHPGGIRAHWIDFAGFGVQTFKKKNQKPLYEAILKVKEGTSNY